MFKSRAFLLLFLVNQIALPMDNSTQKQLEALGIKDSQTLRVLVNDIKEVDAFLRRLREVVSEAAKKVESSEREN